MLFGALPERECFAEQAHRRKAQPDAAQYEAQPYKHMSFEDKLGIPTDVQEFVVINHICQDGVAKELCAHRDAVESGNNDHKGDIGCFRDGA